MPPPDSNRIPNPLPNPPIKHIPPFPLRIPPKKHDTFPPAREPIMQIKAQIPRSLVPRRRRTLLRRFARENFRADLERDGRVGVAWVGVGERVAAGAGGEGVG